MRKELKSKSRRKWLLGGSLAFASVALLTTGFATWVIGTSKPSGDGQVHIDVDTAKDKSVELTFKLDDKDNGITVAEDAENPNPNPNLPIEKSVTPDWSIKIQDLNIVVGEAFYNESLTGKTNLKIAFALQKEVTEDKNSATKDIVGVRGETGPSWNYIELAKKEFTFTLPISYPTNGKIYDISNDATNNPDGNKTLSFYWGSYFGRKAPSKFYQENEPKEGSHEYYQNALKELQAMRTDLMAGDLTLTATFVY